MDAKSKRAHEDVIDLSSFSLSEIGNRVVAFHERSSGGCGFSEGTTKCANSRGPNWAPNDLKKTRSTNINLRKKKVKDRERN